MKNIYILLIAILTAVNTFAQRASHVQRDVHFTGPVHSALRTTAAGDTLHLSNIASGDTLVAYTVGSDSGYYIGTNYWGDQAFAERYDFNPYDSTMSVIGVLTHFTGTVNSSSTKTVALNIWFPGGPQYITANTFYSGFPYLLLASDTVSVTQLGIGGSVDTVKQFMFATPVTMVSGSFFAGYSINYSFASLAGDTIALATSKDGHRTSVKTYLDTIYTNTDTLVDTIINVQNATQWSDQSWHDNYVTDSISNDLAIYPIVRIWYGLSTKGLHKDDLTFYGCYPNPATDVTHVKFALSSLCDVTLQLLDMSGRVVRTLTQSALSAGEHTVPLSTGDIPSGDYIYFIRTSTGSGMASKLTIIK